ncbi:alpha/beta fold hydrolase [Mumia sp. DW29H23]|uniref:alpha/beta fold hydrolase n=1 Tax=Mumia sp. DW29H23 TaxID=3421241 RepID=UPI003D68E6AA
MRAEFVSSRGLAGWVAGSGPEVVLLHGGPGMSDYMESLLPELGGYRVASFQQRGVAPSTLDGPYDVPTLRDDALDVFDTLGWKAPAVIGHSWGGHLLLHLLAAAPARVGAALVVDPLGAVGDGGLAELDAEVDRRLPTRVTARLRELDALAEARALTPAEVQESLDLAWPAYFSSLEAAQPIPQTGHAPSAETWASIRAEMPRLAERLRGCTVPTRFVHGERDPMPLTASTDTAEILGAPVDVLPGDGHFCWLEDPGCVRRSLDRLLSSPRAAGPTSAGG